jgi:hypothetical protein
MQRFPVYVPNSSASALQLAAVAQIDPKSAIVGECTPDSVNAAPDDRLRIYYEGNRYQFADMITFADRAQRACERLRERAPTIATSVAPKRALSHVGFFTFGHGVDVENATELIALARWLGLFDNDQLQSDQLHAELRLSNGTPASRLRDTMRSARGEQRPIREQSPRELGRDETAAPLITGAQCQSLLDTRTKLAQSGGEVREIRALAGFVGMSIRGLAPDGGDLEVLLLPDGKANVGTVAVPTGVSVSWGQIEAQHRREADDSSEVAAD